MQALITPAECRNIAEKSFGNGIEVTDHVIAPVDGERRGFLGDYFILEIFIKDDENNNAKRNYFVKAPPPSTEDQQDDTNRIFAKEAFLYSSLLKDFSKYSKTKWRPECYLARNDILVLEDLKQIGFDSVPSNIETNIDHMKMFLSSLAALHSCSIAYEKDIGLSIGSIYSKELFETSILKDLDWFKAGLSGLQAIASVHPKFQSKEYQLFIKENFFESLNSIYDMINASNEFTNVLCHRDTWQNNALFRFENGNYGKPVKSVLVDFQICRYCPPAIDVLFAIYLNTSRSTRLSILSDCLEWYHQQLTKELDALNIDVVDHISWESFLKSCQYLELVAVVYNGVAATLVKLPGGILQDLQIKDPEEFAKYRTVSRKDILLRTIREDDGFAKYMFEAVEDLLNIIYKEHDENKDKHLKL